MNKILISGLIAAVASTAYAGCPCSNNFYIGANFGVNFTETKAKVKPHTYATGDTYGGSSSEWKVSEVMGLPNHQIPASAANSFSDESEDLYHYKNKKAKFISELFFGYEHKIKNFRLGIELSAGFDFGKTKIRCTKIEALRGEDTITLTAREGSLKQRFHIALMPRLGYQFRPELEGYITFGAKLNSWHMKLPNIVDNPAMEEGALENFLGIGAGGKLEKKNSIRITPVIGAGFRYEITPKVFAKFEYNYEFRNKAKISGKMAPEFRKIPTTSHAFKLGIGYKF